MSDKQERLEEAQRLVEEVLDEVYEEDDWYMASDSGYEAKWYLHLFREHVEFHEKKDNE